MKKFHIEISFTEDGKEQSMAGHSGFTFEEICAIENFIEAVKHRTGTLDDLIRDISKAGSYKNAFKLPGREQVMDHRRELINLKEKFENMPLTEYEGDYK
jgi:hypothetical protein